MNLQKNPKELSIGWRTVIAATASAFAMLLIAGLWHNVILAEFYQKQSAHVGKTLIIATYIFLGFLMAGLYPYFRRIKNKIVSGLVFGSLFGLVWVFPYTFMDAASHGEPLLYIFQNSAWHLVEQGLGGIIVALIYSIKRK